MIRLLLIVSFLLVEHRATLGQCVVSRNASGQVVTTCEQYFAQSADNQLHKQAIYLGTEFLTFPSWQSGKVRLDESGKEIACQLAYSLVSNNVMCRFGDDPTVKRLTPYAFTISGLTFTRQLMMASGKNRQIYTTALYAGPTQFLKRFTNQLVPKPASNGYEQSSIFDGTYYTQEKYYIRKGNAPPEVTNLTRTSLLTILYDQAKKIAARLPDRDLTTREVINALTYYDSLTLAATGNRSTLSNDPVFSQFLHTRIKYPDEAWLSSVYGRVYVGFEVDTRGQLTNLITLSPENVGFGFDRVVKQALQKMAKLTPGYAGRYALPVAFTFANTREQTGAYLPVNTLPDTRLDGRTVLDELVVPITVTKPVVTSREVWGYYK